MTREPRVFGWQSPWSGDERDPITRSYKVWFFLYRRTRIAKHWIGWHDYRPRMDAYYCDWCGAVSL